MFYGVVDFLSLLFRSDALRNSNDFINTSEVVILLGAALAQFSYRAACRVAARPVATSANDWSERSMIIAGGTLWIVCTWMTWRFKVNIVVSNLSHDVSKGLGGLNSWQAGAFILAIMLQPLGILIATYAQCKFKRFYMTPVLVAMVVFQLLMGFVTDVKADALTGAIIVLVTKVLADGRIPKSWLLAFIAFTAIAFPVLQANRAVRGVTGADHNDAAQDIGQTIHNAIEASKEKKSESDREQTFFERLSLVGSVETIVTRTGKGVDFQHGYTLTPLLTTFIPRTIWPTKPDVQTGRVMNKEFQISPVADTFISPSHLGELYWNFGWIGVIVGMISIGSLLGYLGGRFNFENTVTLTQLMVVLVTVRLLIIGFEGTIAVQYTVWMRSMLAIGLLHLMLAKTIAYRRTEDNAANGAELRPRISPSVNVHLPNLMR